MTRFFCVSVTFLDRLFHGRMDAKTSEWPPSPMRLFQALLAGSRTGCRSCEWSEAKIAAFRWLERRGAPVIIAPSARLVATGCTYYVPDNDADKRFDRQIRLTSKVVRPHRLNDGDTVHYLWEIHDDEWPDSELHARILCREARCLLALGWGIDQTVGDGRIVTAAETNALQGNHWRPSTSDHTSGRRWQVPCDGSLNDLERAHQSFLERIQNRQYRPPIGLQRYRTVTYVTDTVLPRRFSARFELPDGVAFRPEDTARVAAMLRSLICRPEHRDDFRDQFGDDTESYLAGHIRPGTPTPPRFSYLPLPTIGHEHADGMVRRLLIAEPYGGSGAHARWAERRLRGQVLRDETGNERGILLDPWRPGSPAMIDRYVGEHRIWTSVTPVVLPGYDDFRGISDSRDPRPTKAERLFLKALQQAGIPVMAVSDVTLRKAPFWAGAQHPRLYYRPNYLQGYATWHAHVVFRQPVGGPLALGAGRHCGLGLFGGAG
jgi:CRISPR-associated protein Csb2